MTFHVSPVVFGSKIWVDEDYYVTLRGVFFASASISLNNN